MSRIKKYGIFKKAKSAQQFTILDYITLMYYNDDLGIS